MRKPPSIRTLTLVSAGSGLPELRELQRREREDELPRSSLFRHVLNSDILDEHLLQRTPGVRSLLYRSLPTGLAQIVEAYLRMGRYDAIISWAEHLGIPLAGLMKAVRIRPVHVALFSWISKPKKARLLKHVHAQIDRIILWSSVQRDFAIEKLAIPPQKIALMRYYVDQQFWRPFPEQGSDMICSAGREMRDYETLIESLRGSAIPCHIAARSYPGKVDAWMKYLQTLDHPPGNVTVGARSPRELRLLYARSRFVVIPILPTDTDNGVTCILEAMAMGKAVICSKVLGQRDVIQEGNTGLYVAPRDPRALREAIEYLWANPEIAARMGRNARMRIESHHTVEQWVDAVRGIVEETIEERRGYRARPAHRVIEPADTPLL